MPVHARWCRSVAKRIQYVPTIELQAFGTAVAALLTQTAMPQALALRHARAMKAVLLASRRFARATTLVEIEDELDSSYAAAERWLRTCQARLDVIEMVAHAASIT